jgi:hypothetical protein
MERTAIKPVVGVGFTALLLGFVGCYSRTPDPPAKASNEVGSPAAPAAKPSGSSALPDWPTPLGTLVITGERLGYLEPCGCTEGQTGGLGRLYDLVERLKAKGWPVVLTDLGSIADPSNPRGGPVESKIKFSVAMRALGLVKYDAMALGADDLKLGVFESLGQLLNLHERSPKPALLAANVVVDDAFKGLIQPSVRTQAGSVKLGITAVLDPAAFEALADPDKALLKVEDPEASLRAVVADLEKDTDVQVLMVQGTAEKAEALCRAFPAFELVVAKSEIPDPESRPKKINAGKTMLVQVGQQGKYAGLVGVYSDRNERLRYQRVTLGLAFARTPEPMKKLIEDEYQDELKQSRVVEDYPKHDYVAGAPGATFVGAETCKTCHANTYSKWASTKHAVAFDDLYKHEPGRDRRFDAECISCHATALEYTSGYRSEELTPGLKGNQCENCHGPGSKHAAEPDNKEYRALMRQPVANPETTRFCYRCHDHENSPKFDFKIYYPKIIHVGLDKYDDPKVHNPVSAKVAAQPAASAGR